MRETHNANDPFFTNATTRGRGGLWQHDEETVGSAILGRLDRTETVKFKKGKPGVAIVFAPAVERKATGELVCHATLSTLLSATLVGRIDPAKDIGTVFAVRHTGFEKSKQKGRTAFKTFDVATTTPAALVAQLKDEGATDLIGLVSDGPKRKR